MEISTCSQLLDTDFEDWTASNNDRLSVMDDILSGEILGHLLVLIGMLQFCCCPPVRESLQPGLT